MPYRTTRIILIGLHLFLAANAVFGALWVVPTLPPEWLEGTPFRDYTIPALALGVVVGGGSLLAAALLIVRAAWGVPLSVAVGAGMAVFEVVEVLVVGWDVWLHALGLKPALAKGLPGVDASSVPAPLGVPLPLWLQPFFFVFGIVVTALALRLWARGVRARPHALPFGRVMTPGQGTGRRARPGATPGPAPASRGSGPRPLPQPRSEPHRPNSAWSRVGRRTGAGRPAPARPRGRRRVRRPRASGCRARGP
jgi:hypothetical protein